MPTEKIIKVDAGATVEFESKGGGYFVKVNAARISEKVDGKDTPMTIDRDTVLALTGSGKDAKVVIDGSSFAPKLRASTDNPITVDGSFTSYGGKQIIYVDSTATDLAMVHFAKRIDPSQKPQQPQTQPKPSRTNRPEPKTTEEYAITVSPENSIDSVLKKLPDNEKGIFPGGSYTFQFKNEEGAAVRVAVAEGGRIDFRTAGKTGGKKPAFTLSADDSFEAAKSRLAAARSNLMNEIKTVLETKANRGIPTRPGTQPKPGEKPKDAKKDALGIPDDVPHGDTTVVTKDVVDQKISATIPLSEIRGKDRDKKPEAEKPAAPAGQPNLAVIEGIIQDLKTLDTSKGRFFRGHKEFSKQFDELQAAAVTMKDSLNNDVPSTESLKTFHTLLEQSINKADTLDDRGRSKAAAGEIKSELGKIQDKLNANDKLKKIAAINLDGLDLAGLGVSSERPLSPLASDMGIAGIKDIASAMGVTGGLSDKLQQALTGVLKASKDNGIG